MNKDQTQMQISKPEDIENFKSSVGKATQIQLNMKDAKIEKKDFIEIFDKLAETKKTEFKLDLSNTEMDDERISSLTNCLTKWDSLKDLSINFSNIKFSDKQFSQMINSIQNNQSIEKLQLNLNNVDLDRKMRKNLETLFEKVPNMKEVAINTKNSNITQEDVQRINSLISTVPRFVHFHDFPSLYPSHFCQWHGYHDWPMLL